MAYAVGIVDGKQVTSPDGASSVSGQSSVDKITIEISKDPKLTLEITPKDNGTPDSKAVTGFAEIKKSGDHHPHNPLRLISSVVINSSSETLSDSVDGSALAIAHLKATDATETPILFNPK